MEEGIQCEAKYGDIRCPAKAETSIVADGFLFDLCKDCARVAKKQIKLKNHGKN